MRYERLVLGIAVGFLFGAAALLLARPGGEEPEDADPVDRDSEQSFPASDPPAPNRFT